MRIARWLSLAGLLLSACGGGASGERSTPTAPTPPTPTPVVTSLAVSAGANQAAFVNTSVAVQPAVVVRDQNGAAMAGVPVSFVVVGGGGTITGATQTTDAAGIASVGSWTLGATAGTNTLSAAATGLSGVSVTFTATALTAVLTVQNATDVVNGDTTSPSALVASPGADGIALREALTAANRANSPFTITLSATLAGQVIRLAGRLPLITRDGITLTGLTANGQPNVTIDASAVTRAGPILYVGASSFSVSGLRFAPMPANGSAIQVGGATTDPDGRSAAIPASLHDITITRSAFSSGNAENAFAVYVVADRDHAIVSDVTVANSSFDRLFEGINLQAGGSPAVMPRNTVIQDVQIYGNTFSQHTTNATSAVEVGIHNGTNGIIRRVEIFQNTFSGNLQGIVVNCNAAAVSGQIQDTQIHRNVFSGNLQALGVVGGVSAESVGNVIANTQFINNLVHLTGFAGGGAIVIQVIDHQNGGPNNRVTGLAMVNNTVFSSGPAGPPGSGAWVTSSGGVSGISVLNGIFWGITGDVFKGVATSQVSYTLVTQAGFAGNNQNIASDPLFVDAAAGDFRLQAGSPSRGAGNPTGAPTIDIGCHPRTGAPDLGAYAYGATGNNCANTAATTAASRQRR